MGLRQSKGNIGLYNSHPCVSLSGKADTAVVQAAVGGLCMRKPWKSASKKAMCRGQMTDAEAKQYQDHDRCMHVRLFLSDELPFA